MTHAFRKTRVVLTLGLVLCTASSSRTQEPQERPASINRVALAPLAPISTTPHFAFHSDFATNLNDALLEAGRDRNFDRPELFQYGEETACFDGLPPSARTAWNHAVSYYAEIISSEKWNQRQQYWIRMDLMGVEELDETRDLRFVGIARGFRETATPAYGACRWATQDAENRNWIAEVVAQLTVHEEAVSLRLANLYETPLAGLPIRVDVMETVNWSGATTILLSDAGGPAGGHIQISIGDHGPTALELVFHEASHTLMDRRSPVRNALTAAAEELEIELPSDLWHAVLFYTTGDVVHRVLETAGESEYTPMLFAQDIFGSHHEAMKSGWTAYLDGERTLEEASEDLIRALGSVAK